MRKEKEKEKKFLEGPTGRIWEDDLIKWSGGGGEWESHLWMPFLYNIIVIWDGCFGAKRAMMLEWRANLPVLRFVILILSLHGAKSRGDVTLPSLFIVESSKST